MWSLRESGFPIDFVFQKPAGKVVSDNHMTPELLQLLKYILDVKQPNFDTVTMGTLLVEDWL